MKRAILFLIFWILVSSIGFVIADDFSCETNDDCVLKDTPYCCGEKIEYSPGCYHSEEIPEEVNCTGIGACPGIEAINRCDCVDTVCIGSFKELGLTCEDSDNGKDYYTKGSTIEGGDAISVDNCIDDTFLREQYCEDEKGKFEKYKCPNGCFDGVCLTGGNLENNETKIKKKIIIFKPWQKRNESECQEGCKCVGAVVSCPTETGKIMSITAGVSENLIIIINKTNVSTELELELEMVQNKTRLRVRLSNGKKGEIKIMPDVASEKALERLRLKVCSEENNCTIQLKEVGKRNETELVYEFQIRRKARLFGIFGMKMNVRAEINAENSKIDIDKPWWAFLASEPEE